MYVKGNANDVQTNNLDGEALFWVQTKVTIAYTNSILLYFYDYISFNYGCKNSIFVWSLAIKMVGWAHRKTGCQDLN